MTTEAAEAIGLMRSHGATIGYVRVGFADETEIGGSMGKEWFCQPSATPTTGTTA